VPGELRERADDEEVLEDVSERLDGGALEAVGRDGAEEPERMGQYMRRTGLIGLFGAGLRRRHEADLARSPERWGRPGRSRSLIFRATVPLSASSPWGPGSWRGRGGRAQGERQSRGMHREVSSPVSGQKRGQPQRTRDGCAPGGTHSLTVN
jgi:hypothetical protein